MTDKTCPKCGKVFTPWWSGAKFCSRKCSGTERNGKVIQKCQVCGKEREVFASKGSRKFCSYKCAYIGRNHKISDDGLKRISDSKTGSKNPNWKGGKKLHYGWNWHKQSKEALKRDKVCQSCGKPSGLFPLHVHHIIPFKSFSNFLDANKLSNLVVLCPKCHRLVEYGRIPCPHPSN